MTITFAVLGTPAPGGSKSAFALKRRDGSLVKRANGSPVINITDAGGKANKIWRRSVAIEAKKAMGFQSPFEGAVRLTVGFVFRRPPSHLRADGRLRDGFTAHHGQKPDCLKLVRSTEDAMTSIVWKDDAQVIEIQATKGWTDAESGATITVEEICPALPRSARDTLFGAPI